MTDTEIKVKHNQHEAIKAAIYYFCEQAHYSSHSKDMEFSLSSPFMPTLTSFGSTVKFPSPQVTEKAQLRDYTLPYTRLPLYTNATRALFTENKKPHQSYSNILTKHNVSIKASGKLNSIIDEALRINALYGLNSFNKMQPETQREPVKTYLDGNTLFKSLCNEDQCIMLDMCFNQLLMRELAVMHQPKVSNSIFSIFAVDRSRPAELDPTHRQVFSM